MASAIPSSASVYTEHVLKVYNLWVLGISNRFFWKCSTRLQLQHFETFQRDEHLDIGVGTGYYLVHSSKTKNASRIALMDINRNSLSYAEKALSFKSPEIYIQDILQPVKQKIPAFDSISIFYLLHCLPGSMTDKEPVIAKIKALLKPSGVVFGSTILGVDQNLNALGTALMNRYNHQGVFSNLQDSKEGLEQALQAHFSYIKVITTGHVALFAASNERI